MLEASHVMIIQGHMIPMCDGHRLYDRCGVRVRVDIKGVVLMEESPVVRPVEPDDEDIISVQEIHLG